VITVPWGIRFDMPRHRAFTPVLLAGFLVFCLGLQGCVATTVAGATLGVAGMAVKTTAKVTRTVTGAVVHVATAPFHARKPGARSPG
jgi:hypothetical protein